MSHLLLMRSGFVKEIGLKNFVPALVWTRALLYTVDFPINKLLFLLPKAQAHGKGIQVAGFRTNTEI